MLLLAACSSGPIALGRIDETLPPAADGGGIDSAATPPSPEAGTACEAPLPARHFGFDGVGTTVADSRGGPSAELKGGAALDGSGVVHLDGVDDYVDLPNGLLAGKSEITIAVWVLRPGGPSAYKRIFDIGESSEGEDPASGVSTTGRTYLAATTATGNVPSGLGVLMSSGGPGGEIVALSDIVLDKEMHFVVVVVSAETLSLFYEGNLVARVPRSVDLGIISDVNAWLGRSQYSADGYFEADYADLRIFDRALTECEVAKIAAQGASPP